MKVIVEIYIAAAGIMLILMAVFEFFRPERAFYFFQRYVFYRYFPLHGLFLIAAGFPMILYRGTLSNIIFVIGVITILTGPFILFYPEKIRNLFAGITEEMGHAEIRRLIYADASLRLLLGALFAAGTVLNHVK